MIVAVPLESRADMALRYSPIFVRRLALSHFLRSSVVGVVVCVVPLSFIGFASGLRRLFSLRDFLTCSMRRPSLQHSSVSPASHCIIMC